MAVAVAGENRLEINDAKKREGKPSEETFWQGEWRKERESATGRKCVRVCERERECVCAINPIETQWLKDIYKQRER